MSGEQLRVLENVSMAYSTWLETAKTVLEGRPWLTWKTVQGREYLYEKVNRRGDAKSLGPRSPETERLYQSYRERMDARGRAQDRVKATIVTIDEQARIYRSLQLPLIDATAGAILREADLRGMLGTSFLVVGTATMAAYEIEAQDRFATGLDATLDFDLTWCGGEKIELTVAGERRAPLSELLRAVDDTFVVNTERPFQARNARAYEVEILCASSVYPRYPETEPLRPEPMDEQEWLLRGRPVSQVLCDRDSQAVRMVVPDPRWMALHKLWLSERPSRNRKKVAKDRGQGEALLKAIQRQMPHYKFDAAFHAGVPEELARYLPR